MKKCHLYLSRPLVRPVGGVLRQQPTINWFCIDPDKIHRLLRKRPRRLVSVEQIAVMQSPPVNETAPDALQVRLATLHGTCPGPGSQTNERKVQKAYWKV